jgi:hypothetical protein
MGCAEFLAPTGAEVRFDLIPTEASAPRQVCKVTWNDDSGDRERYATLQSPL